MLLADSGRRKARYSGTIVSHLRRLKDREGEGAALNTTCAETRASAYALQNVVAREQ